VGTVVSGGKSNLLKERIVPGTETSHPFEVGPS
jgi:hypothetical protein